MTHKLLGLLLGLLIGILIGIFIAAEVVFIVSTIGAAPVIQYPLDLGVWAVSTLWYTL